MPKRESKDGETLHGGDREVVYYYDDDWKPAEKSVAIRVKIVEYDGKEPIYRVYGVLKRKDLIHAS